MTDDVLSLDKAELLASMEESWLRLNGFVESLTPAQLTEPVDAAGWTVKDHLAHLAAWERGMIHLLDKRPRHEAMGIDGSLYASGDIDAMNEGIRQLTLHAPLDAVLDELRQVHLALVSAVEAIPEEDLQRAYSWFLPDDAFPDDGKPIIERVSLNADRHFDEHLPWMQAIVAG